MSGTMAGQSSRGRYYHYPSHASMSPMDPGQMYGATREMGPPPLVDWPPQPVEIPVDAIISRTLPSPQATVSASNAWDGALLQPNLGDVYGSSNHPRLQQLSLDGQNRASPTTQLPLAQWYLNNDGPWIPKGISETAPEDGPQSRQTDNRMHSSYIGQYKGPNPVDPGSFQYPVPSDSGYGTRRSDGNASVFSADVPERDQDCQSLQGQVSEYQPYPGVPVHHDLFQSAGRVADPSWSQPTPSPSSTSRLVCPRCHKPVKTQSEMKKHELRHTKPFMCTVPGCLRTGGFSTTNDLERHTKSKHPSAMPETAMTKKFRCLVPGCKSKEKSWPRLDNFRSHLKRVHGNQYREDEALDELIRRGEYTEKNGLPVQEKESTQQPSLEQPRNMREDVHDTQSGQKAQTNWRSNYPESNTPSGEYVAPNTPQADFEPKVATSNENSPSQSPPPETVQPLAVILRTESRIPETRIPLDNVLAPVGQNKPVNSKAEPASSKSVQRGVATGKAPRQNLVSSDAIIGVVKKALAGANITDAPHRANHQDSERNSLPNGRMSSRDSEPTDPSSASPSARGENGSIKPMDTPTPEEEAQDSETLKKDLALEVLKIIREQGYTVQKDPTHAPKTHNLGSAASNKSDKKVTCQLCKSFTGRPCELKKHMKRHERPYGCTFLTCNKTFGSKNDWKRHENSQHFHLETWRCDMERLEGGTCAKVCYRRQTFQEHLTKAHEMSDKELINSKLDSCRIGRNCQSRFWCGFCNKLVELKKRGVEAWTERFDHIDDHFMGRHKLAKQGIQDWVPMDSDRPKGEVECPHSLGTQDEDGLSQSASGSPTGTSPEAKASAGGSPSHAASHEEASSTTAGPKRGRSSSEHDASQPTAKRPRPDTVVYCCQCKTPHNPRIDLRCTGCLDSPHQFCGNCKVEAIRITTI